MNREKEIGGNHWNQKGHPDHTDAMFRAYTKTIPPTIVGSGAFGVLDRTEFGEEVASSSWGGGSLPDLTTTIQPTVTPLSWVLLAPI